MTTNYIKIDDVSSLNFGLFIDRLPRFPAAVKLANYFQVSGRLDSMYQSVDFYENISVDLTGIIRGFQKEDEIIAWISKGKTLFLSNQPDRIGEIRQVTNLKKERIGSGALRISWTFVCAPFKISTFNPFYTPVTNPYYFKTRGTIYSEPTIKVFGATDGCTVTVNGVTLATDGITGDFYIDVNRRIVYQVVDGENVSVQDKTSGRFWDMLLVPSEDEYNVIEYTNADSVQYICNERWL